MKQKTLSSLAAGLLAVAMTLPLPASAAGAKLSDVPQNAWYTAAVEYCWEKGMMEAADGLEFLPEAPLTRAMVAAALYQIYDRPQVSLEREEFESGTEEDGAPDQQDQALTSPFSDVDLDDPDADAILWAWQEGLVTGYDDGRFGPDDPVTREQTAAILFRFADWQGRDTSGRAGLEDFRDGDQVSPYAREPVAWAVEAGLLTGRGEDTLAPGGTASRAETAALLARFSPDQEAA
mgnify:CR=1 FL=1